MTDLFKALKPTAHLSKNGFDLSRKHVFSSKAGQCLPVLALETVPGDHHEIDLIGLTRTRTMNTAAFLRGKQRFDFFFVPYSQLWHPFNQFITQRDDKHSTRQQGHINCPVVSLKSLLSHIYNEFSYGNEDILGYEMAGNMIRLLDLLGYGDFRWLLDVPSGDIAQALIPYDDKYVNVFRLAAYQHIWYDYYRNKYYDVADNSGIQASDIDFDPRDYIFGFNFDDLQCTSFATSVIANGSWSQSGQPLGNEMRLRMLLRLNYIQWKKDLFTSALPSQQFGAVSSVDISGVEFIETSGGSVNRAIIRSSNGELRGSSALTSGTAPSLWGQQDLTFDIPSAFDVLSLRKAEALQAWKQNTLRAGNMTKDAYEAHFGVSPYYDNDENVRYLGSFSAAINVSSVESTSFNSSQGAVNGRVGDLAANGVISVNGNKLKFDARDYGVIMCISSFLPESEYSSNALDKANTLYEQFDFFTPEFQNIGLEPVTLKENRLGGILPTSLNTIIGYSPRYYMYKQAVDKVFGEFKDTMNTYLDANYMYSTPGTMEAWVAPRTEYVRSSARTLGTFYVDPAVLDNIFAVSVDGLQTTDQLISNVYFDIKSIRPMSVLGLPQF